MAASKQLTFWQFTAKALIRRRTHLFIILSSITLGVIIITAMTNVYSNFSDKFSRQFRQYGANVTITPKKGELDKGELRKLINQFGDGVVAYSPLSYLVTKSNQKNLLVVGSDFKQLSSLFPYWRLKGKWAATNNEVMMGRKVAEKLKLKPNQMIDILIGKEKRIFKVSAVFESGTAEDDQIFVSGSLVNSNRTVVYLSILGQGNLLKDKLNKAKVNYPNLEIEPVSRITDAEAQVLGRTRYLVWLVSVIILITSLLAVAITLTAVIVERSQEIALKRALGAEQGQISKEFLAESLALGFIGGILGWVGGVFFAQWIGKMVFSSLIIISWPSVFLALLTALLVSAVAAVFPLRFALRIEPAIVLKGE